MPESNAELSKLMGLDWLVTARNQIQSFMLELSKEAPPNESDASALATERLRKWNLFLGAAFSLWRAVFLVNSGDVGRTTADLGTHAKSFLIKVIETNAISFPDELRERAWSGGFYLNNARYRTQLLLKDYEDIRLQESISNAILKDVWNETFNGLQKAFVRFKSNC